MKRCATVGGLLSENDMVVVHAFGERSEIARDLHLSFWFGTVRPEHATADAESGTDMPVICWCGGRRVDLGGGVVACYHEQQWPADLEVYDE